MTAHARIWLVIRGLPHFTREEILTLTELPTGTVDAFLNALARAGYLRLQGVRREGRGRPRKVWKLIRNTGPRPPSLRRCLYDPNLDQLTEVPPHVAGAAATRD